MAAIAAEPPTPVFSQELARQLERAAMAFGRMWLIGVEGLEIGDFGPNLLVGCHPDRPDLDFQNRVNGLTVTDAGRIPQIGRFYDERGVRPWWEIVPSAAFEEVSAGLVARQAAQIGFHAVVYGRPVLGPDPSEKVQIDVVDDDATFAVFAHTRSHGHDIPAEVVEQAAADLRGWQHAEGVTLFLAIVDGAPAATAALMVVGEIGYLADAATLPAFRRRGLQSALIHHRLAAAAAAGCQLVCSQATFGGASHRNLQRHGLIGGFTKVVWR